ncbi:hypothetical protein BD289DRAFT_137532 [Coniella lustricola]|uniref:Uncharacterized protein n=1 Tax=Coniella lustricola TaxID=2025994 RepID=A0A2T2ZVK6_9PEZI|nr:hypothetical protein BD289DRAFT_137532 [Coniella lustricola]
MSQSLSFASGLVGPLYDSVCCQPVWPRLLSHSEAGGDSAKGGGTTRTLKSPTPRANRCGGCRHQSMLPRRIQYLNHAHDLLRAISYIIPTNTLLDQELTWLPFALHVVAGTRAAPVCLFVYLSIAHGRRSITWTRTTTMQATESTNQYLRIQGQTNT